jgi:hypothetical protein
MVAATAALVPPWGADTHDGYDIYAGNWPCDPKLIPATPIGVHKASEGLGTYDAKFGQWVKTISARHWYRGAYHVIWPWRDGKPADYIERQADAFLDFTIAQGVDWSQPGWFMQIDNEQFSGMPRIANVAEVRRFADRCISRIGPKVSHYCNPVTDPALFFAPELADLAKWEAQYNRNPSRDATVIRQWGGWVVNGIWDGRPVDANFIEKHDELDRVAGYGHPLDPQEDNDDMATTVITLSDSDAVFEGQADSLGIVMVVRWIDAGRQAQLVGPPYNCNVLTLRVADCVGFSLVGQLPSADSRHIWTGAEFYRFAAPTQGPKGDKGDPGPAPSGTYPATVTIG